MKRSACKEAINSFRVAVQNYSETIDNADDDSRFYSLEEKIAFHNLIPVLQSQLNQNYGKLEKYTKTLTKAEQVYRTAFVSGNSQQDKKKAIWSVLQDLDYMVGKLDVMSDEEFSILLKPTVSSFANQHPHRWYWGMVFGSAFGLVKGHLSEIAIGVVVAAIVAWFGLNR